MRQAASQVFLLKERYPGQEMDARRPFMTTNAPSRGRSPKTFHYPPVANYSFSQFVPGQYSNSFHGETLIRVTNSVRSASLAERLEGIQLVHNPYCAFVETCDRCNPIIRLSTVQCVASNADKREEI